MMMTRTAVATGSRRISRRSVLRVAALVALVALSPVAGAAQESPASPRWEAWLGCWQAATVDSLPPAAQRAIVCVTQVEPGVSVELATVVAGRVSARDTLDASGEQRPISMQGCTGWRRGEWSRDGRRVFLRSEVSCGAGLTRLSTGVLGITNSGEWLDVQTATVAGNATVRAARYRALGTAASSELPAELAGAVRADELRLQVARVAAGTPVSTVEIVEAVQEVDTLAVQSWLIELGQSFEIDGKRIVELAQAGVPGSVTDVMIGVSFPERFVLRSATQGGVGAPGTGPAQDSAMIAGRYGARSCMSAWDPFWMPPTVFESAYYYDDPCSYRYGMRGYGYRGSYYGFAAYGYNSGYYGNYYGPVIVVRDDEPLHGKLVKGRGYTRGGPQQSTGSGADNPVLPAQRGTAESTKSSSGSSSGGSKSGGSSSTGRTAQKRGG